MHVCLCHSIMDTKNEGQLEYNSWMGIKFMGFYCQIEKVAVFAGTTKQIAGFL